MHLRWDLKEDREVAFCTCCREAVPGIGAAKENWRDLLKEQTSFGWYRVVAKEDQKLQTGMWQEMREEREKRTGLWRGALKANQSDGYKSALRVRLRGKVRSEQRQRVMILAAECWKEMSGANHDHGRPGRKRWVLRRQNGGFCRGN